MKKLRITLIVAVVLGLLLAIIPTTVFQNLISYVTSIFTSDHDTDTPDTTSPVTVITPSHTTDSVTSSDHDATTTPPPLTTAPPTTEPPTTEPPTTEPPTTEPPTTEPPTTEPPTTEPPTTEPPISEPLTPPIIVELPDPLPVPEAPALLAEALAGVSADHLFVYNLTTDTLLANKVGEQEIVPASITKLLTMLYALSVMPPETEIIPGDELSLLGYNSSVAHIQKGVPIKLETLLQALLIPSGNDAAYAIAAGVARYITNNPNMKGRAAVDLFLKNAHAYAASLGCTGTNYTCPDGLAWEGHYTSAHDIIIFAKNALAQPVITKYCKMASATVTFSNGAKRTWTTSNRLIDKTSEYYSPYIIGLKTGSLTNNYSICAVAEINGQQFLIGLFRAPTTDNRYQDIHRVLNALLALYGTK